MQVSNFVEKLDKAFGLALPMIGNYAGQTVAGVASTSTHGSGYFTGTLVGMAIFWIFNNILLTRCGQGEIITNRTLSSELVIVASPCQQARVE